MPDRPRAGEQFSVAGRRDLLTVADCYSAVTDDVSGETRYGVTAVAGSRWELVRTDDGWIGTALPADPEAPAF